jgi:hypothetical protein
MRRKRKCERVRKIELRKEEQEAEKLESQGQEPSSKCRDTAERII